MDMKPTVAAVVVTGALASGSASTQGIEGLS
jgi:outer membrane murein-binding lipoprotein Lpp